MVPVVGEKVVLLQDGRMVLDLLVERSSPRPSERESKMSWLVFLLPPLLFYLYGLVVKYQNQEFTQISAQSC